MNQATRGSAGWLWNPWLDLTIGCAGWTLPLLALTEAASRRAWIDVAFVFSLLTIVCNHPHYAATWARAFGSRESAASYRIYTVHLSLLLGLALIAAHVDSALIPLLFTAYVIWSPFHYSGQNFGLVTLFARRRGAAPEGEERRLLRWAFTASYGVWLVTVQGQTSADPYVWSIGLPAFAVLVAGIALTTFFALASTVALARMATRGGWRSVAPCALLLSSQALWFILPWILQVGFAQRVSPVYYSTGALAFMHCAQYLWLTSYAARREAGNGWRIGSYALALVLGGIALFTAGPWIASTVFGSDLRESMLIFIALVNLHHFVLDGAVWKLRDPHVAAMLTGTSPIAPAAVWIRRPAPALSWGVAGALLVVAAIGVTQQYLTRDGSSTRELDLAQQLNRHDTRVAVRRAELLARAQQLDEARAALASVLAPRPANAAALRMYGGLLIAAGRYDEAAEHYRTVEDSVGLDAEGFVNTAVLAMRDGDLDRAAAQLRAALRLEPELPSAHLNLAGVCLEQSDVSCALPHYEAYLTSPAVARDRAYAAAALNAASAAALAQRPQLALGLLEATAKLAAEIKADDLVEIAGRQIAALRTESNAAQ